jgi:hypothetical protein
MLLRAALIWLIIAGAETLHGILRVKLLNPRFGDRRARQVAVVSGSLLILLIGWVTVPWIAPLSTGQSLAAGGLWLALMLALDLGLGRWVMHASWERLLADFNPARGGFLGFGMLVLFVTPIVIASLRHVY